ncbi:Vegetative incompatibility protein HET-E-1 [Madurella mycetomatis]|uniref:Vegetative incompatibility protein HET-E-1 n=1 Tax=Madurella mycetomatis TaxID=100816 RepID=A0A175W045_9PEZI|nr:Vegetative incompatibility protein HET-E-1 [Madurella mycetomatis]
MRLLKLPSLEFEEFYDATPPYAILSHTWDKDEISFQEMTTRSRKTAAKDGFVKIARFAQAAISAPVKYAWVDTCCIDKTSSQELSYCINSMYKWYQESSKCYAYLVDVDNLDGLDSARWFTRGWTLQELIAPRDMEFYDRNWKYLGNKTTLKGKLSAITGIPEPFLLGRDLTQASVALRMSWACKRNTTRPEDIAYCLMGLFDVNMPLLYGEGKRAFTRLQEEIMKSSCDHSLFAWKAPRESRTTYRGLLAESPQEFFDSDDFYDRMTDHDSPYSQTNLGINLTIPLVPWPVAQQICRLPPGSAHEDKNFCIGVLSCFHGTRGVVGIRLERLPGQNQYARIDAHRLEFMDGAGFDPQSILVRQIPTIPPSHVTSRIHAFMFSPDLHSSHARLTDRFGILRRLPNEHGGASDILVQMDSELLGWGLQPKIFELYLTANTEKSKRYQRFLVQLKWDPMSGEYGLWASRTTPDKSGHEMPLLCSASLTGTREMWLDICSLQDGSPTFSVYLSLSTRLLNSQPVLAFQIFSRRLKETDSS